MRHDQWLCDCLHLPQWMVKFHSSYELTEKDYQDGPKFRAFLQSFLQVGARRGRVHSARNFWRTRRHCCRLSMIELDSYGRLQSGALCPSPSLTSVAAVHCLVASSP